MRVLVTGGTGYLGRAVVRALTLHGHLPVVFARHASTVSLQCDYVDGDVRDSAIVDAAVRSCDATCHLAAVVSLWQPDPSIFDAINVGGLANVITSSARQRKRLIYTSSFLALPPHGCAMPLSANDYQRTKIVADHAAAAAANSGQSVVRLYPGVVYGPGIATEGNLVGRLVRDHLAGKLPGILGADHIWSFSWIDDVADAHVRALEHAAPEAAYGLGGEDVPQMRIFEIIKAHTSRPLPRRIPFWLGSAVASFEEARARRVGTPPLLTRGAVEIFRHHWPVDSRAAIRDLGYRIHPLTEGMARLLAEW